ncbi:hypothetical protein [Legionella bononiensis]|uniref:Dot/Icm T4SS effector n=1 Tax=Legionella bononiensis TaxID=2793102 RepID=A0ABS1WEJ7_9GAMM|nr:hypothetical protein [Legionella bononiensis]MBL7479377.1 hypothetical protein [Legionella bononiensis]MBL7527749.1 hypothetical protein [Legionella bononiensis]MBL7563568.1 hypothetical protein [Legionella bononiensis]
MSYDIESRVNLNALIEQLMDYAQHKTPHDIEYSAKKAAELHSQYMSSPERSSLARSEFLNQLYQSLKNYQNEIFKEKSWWGRLIGFFGFLPPHERSVQNVINTVHRSFKQAQKQQDDVLYPNFFFRILRFFGFTSNELFVRKNYKSYTSNEQLKYLSHHLMGDQELNAHEALQGKSKSSAYQHFSNDLKKFIKSKHNHLDPITKEQLLSLKQKLDDGFVLASKIDFMLVIDQMDENKDRREELLFDLAYQIKHSIYHLKVGDSMIIPHGFGSKDGRHATVVECKRINQNEVVFKFINTGYGVNDTESYKTIFKTALLGDNRTRPIKVSSPFGIESLLKDNFIERLLAPVVIGEDKKGEQMNAPLLELYRDGKLHDDEQSLTLQTNGTCAQSSLLAWFKTQVTEPVFVLFSSFIIQRAHNHLQNYKGTNSVDESSLNALRRAGDITVEEKQTELSRTKDHIAAEILSLKSELRSILRKKGKVIPEHMDFTGYYQKKCQGNKLNSDEKNMIANTNSLTPLKKQQTNMVKRALSFVFFQNQSSDEASNKVSDRAQKAVLAKKIAGHTAYIETASKMVH